MESGIYRGSDWLVRLASRYFSSADIASLKEAIAYAGHIHQEFVRINGEPYVNHVIAVAEMLVSWQAPKDVVTAGLLLLLKGSCC